MKYLLQYALGYIGYFLIGYIALRFLIVQNDNSSFAITVVGLFLLINYVSYFEKQNRTPKYSKYIKFTLIIIFLLTTFILMKDSIFS